MRRRIAELGYREIMCDFLGHDLTAGGYTPGELTRVTDRGGQRHRRSVGQDERQALWRAEFNLGVDLRLEVGGNDELNVLPTEDYAPETGRRQHE